MGRQARRLGALLVVATAVAASPAQAAQVSATSAGPPSSAGGLNTLAVTAAPGEPNALAITVTAVNADTVTYSVRDTATAPTPGAGCAAGAPGEVQCTMGKSRPPSGCARVFCSDGGAGFLFDLKLDDGDDSVDLSALPADDGGNGGGAAQIDAGAGADTVLSGPLLDIVDPGPGADSVSTGAGDDRVTARSGGPDGADHLDVGVGSDSVSYALATDPVQITLDGVPDDGAPGEGDDVSGAEFVTGGAGDDVIVADRAVTSAQTLDGGPGADQITGGPGPDAIEADPAEGPGFADVVDGSGGDDDISGLSGGDRLTGGSGRDTIKGGAGGDRISGNAGGDSLFGEAGRDTLLAAGGGRDGVSCGGGRDKARVDDRDDVSGCEHVRD